MTKIEILETKEGLLSNPYDQVSYSKEDCLEAMSEYAKLKIEEFVQCLSSNSKILYKVNQFDNEITDTPDSVVVDEEIIFNCKNDLIFD
jgi:hypothetical protein